MIGVWRVIGCHAVDHSLSESLAQRRGVAGLTERRVHPVHTVVGRQSTIIEQQMVRRHLGSNRNPLRLGPFE
ncbi:Uncharacterised protein [Mycobacteroides abscessus subsp. abscessus]|nr:Uncharacterised protein [Mycobacteroides abscessus subsp. abscessus]